ncbi:hypothetical protein C8R47DRAFT_1084509 [Mycena vitilis]|nr:hypothetical protein C8R47DRAFT_1084509 [Mycena vitilis]
MTASNSKYAGVNFKRRCRISELSSASLKEHVTLDTQYHMFRCCRDCPSCDNFYDHLDEKRSAAYIEEEDEPEPGPGQLIPIGESRVDVVFEWGRLLQYEKIREDIKDIVDDDQVEIGGITVMQILQETEAAHYQHMDYAAVVAQRDIYLEQVREMEKKNELFQAKCGALGVECDQLRQANADSAATAAAHERRCGEAEKATQDLQTRCGALEAECEQLRQANLSLQPQPEAANRTRDFQRPQHAASKRKRQDTPQDECDGRAAKHLAVGKNLGAVTPPPLSDRALWDQYSRMQLPDPSSDPILLARWLQHNEKGDFRGIPISGPNWVVNMRAVRGHQQVLARIDRAARYPEERRRRARSITAILRAIAVPGRYEQLILQGHIEITSQTQLVPCNFGGDADSLSDAEVAWMLAGQGLTVAVADDSWLFCHDYIDSQLASPEHGFELEELRRIRQEESIALKSISPPQGLKPDAEDQYPRTVPCKKWKDWERSCLGTGSARSSGFSLDFNSLSATPNQPRFQPVSFASVIDLATPLFNSLSAMAAMAASVLDKVPNEIIDRFLFMSIRAHLDHDIAYIVHRIHLGAVCRRITAILNHNAANWDSVIITRFMKKSFVELCVDRAQVHQLASTNRTLELTFDTRHVGSVLSTHFERKAVCCLSFAHTLRVTAPFLNAVVSQATTLSLTCRRAQEISAICQQIRSVSAQKLQTVNIDICFPTLLLGSDDVPGHPWGVVTELNMRGADPTLLGSPPCNGLTTLRLSNLPSKLETPWARLRGVLESAPALQLLEIQDVVCTHLSTALPITLPNVGTFLFHWTVTNYDGEPAAMLHFIQMPVVRTLSLSTTGEIGDILGPCSSLLGLATRVDIGGRVSKAAGEELCRTLFSAHELDLRNAHFPSLEAALASSTQDSLVRILLADHIAPCQARALLGTGESRKIVTGGGPHRAQWRKLNEYLLCEDFEDVNVEEDLTS